VRISKTFQTEVITELYPSISDPQNFEVVLQELKWQEEKDVVAKRVGWRKS